MQTINMTTQRQSLGSAAVKGTRPNFLVSMPARPLQTRGAIRCSAIEPESKRGSVAAKAAAQGNYSKRLLSTDQITTTYLSGRLRQVSQYFPDALGVDDFIARVEIALHAYGFHGSNTIACCNLCRDEVTHTLKQKFDGVFGSSFNTNGLGGVLTCGVTGLSAGLSHAPQSEGLVKERYAFFSFPHIGVDSTGKVGSISRPGQPGASGACGALIAALGQIKDAGLAASCAEPGVHDARDPEYSILKQRLARRLKYEGTDDGEINEMSLVDMTDVAERTITDDLEFLIKNSVDTEKADYAVVTGVQIHSWSTEFDDDSPNLEFISPCSCYVVIRGVRTYLDLNSIPPMTPRQISLLAAGEAGGNTQVDDHMAGDASGSAGSVTTVRAIDAPYSFDNKRSRNMVQKQTETYAKLMQEEDLQMRNASAWPSWQTNMRAQNPFKMEGDNSTSLDEKKPEAEDGEYSAVGSSFKKVEDTDSK